MKLFYIIIFIASCQFLLNKCTSRSAHEVYLEEVDKWKKQRLTALKDPYGWPSVVGLYWLKNSIQHFGKSANNDFILGDNAPSSFGRIEKYQDSIVMKAFPNLGVSVNSQLQNVVHMLSDQDVGGPTMASWKSLRWHIIKRQEKYFLRVKDSLSQYRHAFITIPYFPVDTSFRFSAKFIPASKEDTTHYENTLGMKFSSTIAGYLAFDYLGKQHKLTALFGDDNRYFVIFSDNTEGSETYQGGRYLYPAMADIHGNTILDFNYAINPPCVFTPYATCPLPPKENILPFRITAGEKYLNIFE